MHKEQTDLRRLKEELQPYLVELTSTYYESVKKLMEKYGEIQVIDTPKLYNDIWFDFSHETCNKLVIQFSSKIEEKHAIQQKLLLKLQEISAVHLKQVA